MDSEDSTAPVSPSSNLPFPREWLDLHPEKAEEAMNRLTLAEQVQCVLALSGPDQQKLILLSQQAAALVQQLPVGEVYHMIKEIGENDVQPILSLLSPQQVQFVFDMEWWQGDKFLPQRSLDWLEIMDRANDQQIRNWFYNEDFDQKVMVLQALIKVYKADEMTDGYDNIEDLIHFSPDGVFDIYFLKPEAEPVLKKVFLKLYSESQKLFHALMEAVIWYAVTPTVENAYRWYLSRNEPYGIVNVEEALQVYSLLDPEHLAKQVPDSEAFTPDEASPTLAPVYALEDLDSSQFLAQCLTLLKSPERFQSLCWELVYLGNKVLVADQAEGSNPESRHAIMRKVLGYINIGLELGAGGDIARGDALLSRTYLQSLFQVGYAALMRLKWEAETLLKDNGRLVEYVLPAGLVDHFASMVGRFPKVGVLKEAQGEDSESNIEWSDPRSLQDLSLMENFLIQTRFYVRLCKQGYGLAESDVENLLHQAVHPQNTDDLNIVVLTTTALAQYTMFQNLSCEPLPDLAAKSFLEMIFLPNIYPEDPRKVDPDKLEAFRNTLLGSSMAWTEEDRERLNQLLQDCGQNLEVQFGAINVKKTVLWKFTRGLMVK